MNQKHTKKKCPEEHFLCLLSFYFERSGLLSNSRSLGIEDLAVTEDEELSVMEHFATTDFRLSTIDYRLDTRLLFEGAEQIFRGPVGGLVAAERPNLNPIGLARL